MKTKLLLSALFTFVPAEAGFGFAVLRFASVRRKLLNFFLLSFVFCLGTAQVPQGFNYQAIARNELGKPIVDATIKVKLSILTDTTGFRSGSGGTYVWEEEHTGVVTNAYGLFTLIFGGTSATRVQGVTNFSEINWNQPKLYLGTKIANPTEYKVLGGAVLWSVPYSLISGNLSGPVKKLAIKSLNTSPDSAIFEVKNNLGQTVFAVYNEGVRIYVDDGAKGITKGGFAIGGFGTDKGTSQNYFTVSRDSIRAYVNDTISKGITKGGFAIGGFGTEKGDKQEYLRVTRDSTRIYVNDLPGKGITKGGFAIGGFDVGKTGLAPTFFDVFPDSSGKVFPARNKILWYPLKNALLVGKVVAENRDSVGENSFASGYESRSKGNFSQALGYRAIARGDYSTSIGFQSIAAKQNSFAFGQFAQARNGETYAFGRGAIAEGFRSYAFGSAGIDSAGAVTGVAYAKGDYSFAIGQGSQALGVGSFSVGIGDTATGNFSLSLGLMTSARKYATTTMGVLTIANGPNATAIGYKTYARGATSTAIGVETRAYGDISIAMGISSEASGFASTAIGKETNASGDVSTAMGYLTEAIGIYSTASGCNTTANGEGSTAMGHFTKANGVYSIAAGYNTTSGGPISIALGSGSQAIGDVSTAMGHETHANGHGSTAMGIYTQADGNYSIATGIESQAIGYCSTAMGCNTLASGYFTTTLGNYVSAPSGFETVIGRYNTSYTPVSTEGWDGSDRLFVIANGTSNTLRSDAVTVLKNGNIGIGTDTPGQKLDITAGNGRVQAGYSWLTSSDVRYKMNISTLDSCLEKVMAMRGVSFDLINDSLNIRFGRKNIGFIAQELEKFVPEVVITGSDGYKAVSYDKITAVLTEAIKEQQKQIKTLKQENQQLKLELDELKSLVNTLIANQDGRGNK